MGKEGAGKILNPSSLRFLDSSFASGMGVTGKYYGILFMLSHTEGDYN